MLISLLSILLKSYYVKWTDERFCSWFICVSYKTIGDTEHHFKKVSRYLMSIAWADSQHCQSDTGPVLNVLWMFLLVWQTYISSPMSNMWFPDRRSKLQPGCWKCQRYSTVCHSHWQMKLIFCTLILCYSCEAKSCSVFFVTVYFNILKEKIFIEWGGSPKFQL